MVRPGKGSSGPLFPNGKLLAGQPFPAVLRVKVLQPRFVLSLLPLLLNLRPLGVGLKLPLDLPDLFDLSDWVTVEGRVTEVPLSLFGLRGGRLMVNRVLTGLILTGLHQFEEDVKFQRLGHRLQGLVGAWLDLEFTWKQMNNFEF